MNKLNKLMLPQKSAFSEGRCSGL